MFLLHENMHHGAEVTALNKHESCLRTTDCVSLRVVRNVCPFFRNFRVG